MDGFLGDAAIDYSLQPRYSLQIVTCTLLIFRQRVSCDTVAMINYQARRQSPDHETRARTLLRERHQQHQWLLTMGPD
jgi:hypothetical protein